MSELPPLPEPAKYEQAFWTRPDSPITRKFSAVQMTSYARAAIASRDEEITRLRSLLAECRRWVDLSPYHDPDHGPNCHVCRRLDRIDAALKEKEIG